MEEDFDNASGAESTGNGNLDAGTGGNTTPAPATGMSSSAAPAPATGMSSSAAPAPAAEFAIPMEYSTKDWVKNFDGQTGDDLKASIFKALDEKYANTAPDDIKAYNLKDIVSGAEKQVPISDDALNIMAGKFQELGVNAEQGQAIFKEYLNLIAKDFDAVTDVQELDNHINAMFNGNQQQRKSVESLLREFLPKEDRQIIQDIVPNVIVEMFYKVAKGFAEKYAYKEGTANANNPARFRMSEADRDAEYNRIVSQMEALKTHPHKTEEKEILQRQLMNLFK